MLPRGVPAVVVAHRVLQLPPVPCYRTTDLSTWQRSRPCTWCKFDANMVSNTSIGWRSSLGNVNPTAAPVYAGYCVTEGPAVERICGYSFAHSCVAVFQLLLA